MIFYGKLIGIAASIFVILVIVEIIVYRYLNRCGYEFGEARTSIIFGLASTLTGFGEGVCISAVSYFLWSHRIAEVPLDSVWGWVALFFGFEFFYYWGHRAAHVNRFMWASHAVHHSPERLNMLAACRIAVSDILAGRWVFLLPLVLTGFQPKAIFIMLSMNQIYQIWLHTELVPKLGPLEHILNTPANHRVHHAINVEYIDHNFGGTLILFDRMFGTYVEERTELPCRYGVDAVLGSNSLFSIAFHEWIAMARDLRRSESLREMFGCVLSRPGSKPKPQ